jgi:S1-C subfamily serine protease
MTSGGVGVLEVEEGSPAKAAGLTRGHVITAIEGTSITTPGEFREAVAALENKPVSVIIAGVPEGKRLIIAPN